MRTLRAAIRLAILAVGLGPASAQVVGEILPSRSVTLAGGSTTIRIEVDLGSNGVSLGSYGATLLWDPAALSYAGDTGGGDPPFDAAVINRSGTDIGLLRFSDAAPGGASGRIRLLSVTFGVAAAPPTEAVFDLEFTSLFASGTFADLQPQLQVEDATTCVSDYLLELEVQGAAATFLTWNAVGGASGYDVVRGDLGALRFSQEGVDLGLVTCIEDDSQDETTRAGTEPDNPDTETPAAGAGFFYLVRAAAGPGNPTYGFREDCVDERLATAGDCP